MPFCTPADVPDRRRGVPRENDPYRTANLSRLSRGESSSRHPCYAAMRISRTGPFPPIFLHAPSYRRGAPRDDLLAPPVNALAISALRARLRRRRRRHEPCDRFILKCPPVSSRQVIIKFSRRKETKLISSAAADPERLALAFVFTQIVQTINLRRRVISVRCNARAARLELWTIDF